jgi:hypothetical protein
MKAPFSSKKVGLLLVAGVTVYVALAWESPHESNRGEQSWVAKAFAETSGTRLKAKLITGSDGSKLFDPEVLHDSMLQADCAFATAADGLQRCLPILAPSSTDGSAMIYYTDDQCQNGFVLVPAAPGGCTQYVPKYAYAWDPTPTCAQTAADGAAIPRHIYPVGALLQPQGQRYVRNGLGACSPALSGPSGDFIAYSLGAELPASSFVAGTAATGP